ncbi:glycosyltransferase family 2 protein [Pseudomonas sp. N040]|uniref:glycosyltransferase family 2 protein n=1 Tax=Pseudomonas sp. N040 TaxID=2785325 RepID=UPI0018A33A1E|nr:glycosyltransferase [Pseudomonas sp. N040]MBF7731162.1 glycosyltransferase [Pseudomonas sp. N040]MBW7014805.1 glycosyltransferase family 2 protein [Pseudomonas sp. N040]
MSPDQRTGCAQPLVSVIVPVYNHWTLIPRLLACLEAQTLPESQFEVILVDNGSDWIPADLSLPGNACILVCKTPGSYAARNAAIGQARGQFLAFTDADCHPCPVWLEAGIERLMCFPAGNTLIAGAVRMIAANPTRPTSSELYDIALGIPQKLYVERGFGVTANLFVPKRLIELAGPFDAGRFSGGDAEFCRRATRLGARLVYHETALVEHPARQHWSELASKARRIKGGQVCAGSLLKRLEWMVRTGIPPLHAWKRVIRSSGLSREQKLTVCLLQFRLWLVGLGEMIQLVLRLKKPQR